MALKGTLKDFGIADILQLIGQQGKTGMLHLKASEQAVQVFFKDGNIVRAESTTRNKKDLIGAMLVRAELISEATLQAALETQKRTLQRLGDVLIGTKALTAEKFRELVQLQTTETLYRLFLWKSGSYAFEQTDVDADPTLTPLRAESVLMEGFRMVDEWPVVKKTIPNYEVTFAKIRELPEAPKATAFDSARDSAFGGGEGGGSSADAQGVGEGERKVFALAVQGRPVHQLIDLSCLGEFETCKALLNLVNLDYLLPVPPSASIAGKAIKVGGETGAGVVDRALNLVGRAITAVLMVAAIGFFALKTDLGSLTLGSAASASSYSDPATQRFISRQQLTRIEAAISLYRLERGELPKTLEVLVDAGLLRRDDLRYPWRDGYFYRRTEAGSFVLLPPLR